jgi:nicotinamide mononucleotide transporter
VRKVRTWLQNEISGWKKWEVVWLITACAIIVALSIYWQDTWMGILSATTGAACVICTGKGKLSAYVFGLVNSVLYAIISYQAALYGETMLNALYYVPMQFVGFYTWSRHMNTETNEVIKKNMKWTGRLMMTAFILAGTIGYGLLLRAMGDAMPFVDAFTTVTSVAAMLISVKMFAEQWWIWVVVDIVSVYMWFQSFLQGQEYIATLIMWLVYLVNAVIMLVKWEREAKRNERAAHEI